MSYAVRLIGSRSKGDFIKVLDLLDNVTGAATIHVSASTVNASSRRLYRNVAINFKDELKAKETILMLQTAGFEASMSLA